MKDERRALWAGLLLALLLARALRALLSTAFYESLVTLRLNESAGWTLVLLAPALAAFTPTRARMYAFGIAGATSALLPLTRFDPVHLPLAAIAAGAGLVTLPLLAREKGGLVGILVGFALDGVILAASDSKDPLLSTWGAGAMLVITVAAMTLARRLPETPRSPGGLIGGATFGVLLAVEIAFLANPFAAARWLGIPVWVATLASLGGLAYGAMVGGRTPLWILAGVGILDIAVILSPVRALSLGLLQAGLGAAGARLAPAMGARWGGVGLAATTGPLFFTLLFFREPFALTEWRVIVPALAVVALLITWRRARVPRLPVPVIALALAALTLASAIPVRIEPADPGRELTVVTWNIHQGFGNRGALDPDIYLAVLRELDADLILLQESDTTRLSSGGIDAVRYLADALGMRATYGRGGPAILSRFPLANEPLHDSEWRFAAAVIVNGKTVWVDSVHFGRSSALREAQAREVVASVGSPRIVAGDFNLFGSQAIGASPEGPYATLTARFDDAWLETGHTVGDPAGRTFRVPSPSTRIDLILLDDIEALSARTVLDRDTQLASDHLPVVARVRIPT